MKRFAALLCALLFGCGSPEPPPSPLAVAASVEDGERLAMVFDKFTGATGIPIDLRSGIAVEQVDSMIAKEGDTVDLIITDDLVQIWRAADRGVLRPIRSQALGDHHASLRDPDSLWFVHEVRPMGVARDGKTSPWLVGFEELGNPAFEGRLCLSSSALADNRVLLANLIESMGNREAERLVRRWVRNLAQAPYPDEPALRQAIRSGICDYGIISNPHTVFGNWEKMPRPQAYAATAVGVGRHATNPDAAQAFVDWLIRNESVRIPSYTALPHAGIAGWRDEEARLLAERAGYR